MNYLIKICFICYLVFTGSFAFAIKLPKEEIVAGGVLLATFKAEGSAIPIVKYYGNTLKVWQKSEINKEDRSIFKKNNNYLVIIPIALSAKDKIEYTIQTNIIKTKVIVKLKTKNYKEQKLKVDSRYSTKYNDKTLLRIEKESQLINEAYKTYSTDLKTDWNFINPVHNYKKITGIFGIKRVFNENLVSRHSGLDFAKYQGANILATESGEIILVGDFFFSGNIVLIDHGFGLISGYAHLEKTLVKKGQFVKKSQLIGYMGSTGRVTGPHLHFIISLMGVKINPELFFT